MVSGELLRTTGARRTTPEAVFDLLAASTPFRRVTTLDEMADALLLFESFWARVVTGQSLTVDGGVMFG